MISAIFATDEVGGFGFKGGMPWLPNRDDFIHFKRMTCGNKIVMGRSTFESLPFILPNREHYVLSSKMKEHESPSVKIYDSIPKLVGDIGNSFFVIGGADLLGAFKIHCDYNFIYHTVIEGRYPADVTIDLDFMLDGLTLVEVEKKNGCKIYQYTNEL